LIPPGYIIPGLLKHLQIRALVSGLRNRNSRSRAESSELFIEGQAFSLSYDLAPLHPSHVSKLSFFLSLPVSPVALTDGLTDGSGGEKLGPYHTTAEKPGLL
jgi:hypothetical protein